MIAELLEFFMSNTSAPSSVGEYNTSLHSLVIANAITIAMALAFSWPTATLMLPYWIQSVVIGFYSRKRILSLHQFSTEGLKINDQSVEPTESTKRSTANFFLFHYGFFHLIYLIFMWPSLNPLRWFDWLGIAATAVSFVINHRTTFRQNEAADLRGRPNIGTLMFLPYARIVPMHLTIILGGITEFRGVFPLLLFDTLKTLADVLMHKVEHRILQKNAASDMAV